MPALSPAALAPVGFAAPLPSVLGSFQIPLSLLPIYQAAATQYGIPWQLLAAINEVETDFGSNLSVSSAGAEGWMQFLPSTWASYGGDVSGDGVANPYNPEDAIFAAARYLRAAGAPRNLRAAVLAYNHSAAYADSVLSLTRQFAHLPAPIVGALAGLGQGVFPVHARATYARAPQPTSHSDIYARTGAPAVASESGRVVAIGRSRRLGRFVRLRDAFGTTYTYAELGSVAPRYPAARPRYAPRLFATAQLAAPRAPATLSERVVPTRPAPAPASRRITRSAPVTPLPPASAGLPLLVASVSPSAGSPADAPAAAGDGLARAVLADPRISIYPCGRHDIATGQIDHRVLSTLEFLAGAGLDPTVSALKCGHSLYTESGNVSEHASGNAVDISAINGTPIAGHQGPGSITDTTIRQLITLRGAMMPHQIISLMSFPGAPNTLVLASHWNHIHVGFRPASSTTIDLTGALSASVAPGAGATAPLVPAVVHYTPASSDPLQLSLRQAQWRPLRRGALVYAGTVVGRIGSSSGQNPHLRFTIQPAAARAPLIDPGEVLDGWRSLERARLDRIKRPQVGQAMLMSQGALAKAVLADPRVRIYSCGRRDIASGQVDRRVLATLEFLADARLSPTVAALQCGRQPAAVASTPRAYTTGNAVEITAIDGVPLLHHQGRGSIADRAIRALLGLQGTMQPSRIVSLRRFPDADSTVARGDAGGYIEVEFDPRFGRNARLAGLADAVLGSGAWSPTGATARSGGTIRPPRGAPAQIARLIAAGNAIATLPYLWGGGHGSFQATGYDCSGSVSYALAGAGLLGAPLASGQFEHFGLPGPGRWVTIYANADHVWMQVGPWRFDTVALAETGTRWAPSGGELGGFVVRHPVGL